MKLYKFYTKPSEKALIHSDDLAMDEKYPLYAFTNNKEFRKKFKETRDMSKFIEIKSECSKSEYVEFTNSKRSQMLDEYSYMHFPDHTNSRKHTDVRIVSTWSEKEIVQACLDDNISTVNESLDYDFFPMILSKKYLKALSNLEFITYWKLYGDPNKYMDLLTEEEQEEFLDYSYPSVTYDELEMFINIFSGIMK